MSFNLTTHNGTITVRRLSTDTHRTYRIRTEDWCDGKRVISIKTSSETYPWKAFGFVDEFGIKVWGKCKASHTAHKEMLEQLEGHKAAGNVEVLTAGQCRVCNKKLTNPESIQSGIGPICAGK